MANLFENGTKVSQIVQEIFKKTGLPIPQSLNHLKISNQTAAQLYNWNILNEVLNLWCRLWKRLTSKLILKPKIWSSTEIDFTLPWYLGNYMIYIWRRMMTMRIHSKLKNLKEKVSNRNNFNNHTIILRNHSVYPNPKSSLPSFLLVKRTVSNWPTYKN